jgi:hypothetical protein
MHVNSISTRTRRRVLAGLLVALFVPVAGRAAAAKATPYAQTVTCYSASTNQCTALFPAVPANMQLVVQFVASSVATPTALASLEFDVVGIGFIPILHTLQGNDSSGNKIYVASQPFTYYFAAGQQPYIDMNAQPGSFEFMSGQITLTGYLIPSGAGLQE